MTAPSAITAIHNYRPIDAQLATSGQPNEDQIAAIADRTWADPAAGALDRAQAAAIALAAAVVHSPHVDDELFERVRAQFSDREIVELLLAIGDYLMLARVMTVLEIDLDEPAGDSVLRGRRDRPADLA